MRHKYDTRGIVLSRMPLGEATTLVTVLTPSLGLVRARAQGLRQSGAKLAHALTTLSESSLILVRGKEGWRIAGAVLETPWFTRLTRASARAVAGRLSGLLIRLAGGEEQDPNLFAILLGLMGALETLPEEAYDAAEILAAVRILAALGLDAGVLPGESSAFAPEVLAEVGEARTEYIARINRGITASGL